MCVRLNDVWSLHGALVRFEEKSRRAVDVDLVRAVEHRLQQADMSDLLNGTISVSHPSDQNCLVPY